MSYLWKTGVIAIPVYNMRKDYTLFSPNKKAIKIVDFEVYFHHESRVYFPVMFQTGAKLV